MPQERDGPWKQHRKIASTSFDKIPRLTIDINQPLPYQGIMIGADLDELSRADMIGKKHLLSLLNLVECEKFNHQKFIDNLQSATLIGAGMTANGCAIIEKDPHFACMNKTFENIWILCFSKVMKLAHRRLETSNDAKTSLAICLWEKDFLNHFMGILVKLHDILMLYKEPESVMHIVPSLRHLLPCGYSASNESERQLYQLPFNYLLRDIALCLARIHSYEDKELEKVWMDKASSLNIGISGRRYKDAWEHLTRKNGHLVESDEQRIVQSNSGAGKRTFAEATAFSTTENQVSILKNDAFGLVSSHNSPEDIASTNISFGSIPAAADISPSSSALVRSPSDHGGYGTVTASLSDLTILKSFASRNSFLEGLLQGAATQGLIKLDEDHGTP